MSAATMAPAREASRMAVIRGINTRYCKAPMPASTSFRISGDSTTRYGMVWITNQVVTKPTSTAANTM